MSRTQSELEVSEIVKDAPPREDSVEDEPDEKEIMVDEDLIQEELVPIKGVDPNHNDEEGRDFRVYISWENLRFEVDIPTEDNRGCFERMSNPIYEKKLILDNLAGHVKPGEILAVIGPSGSGKTSFLNCIAGRISEGVSGSIKWNDVERPMNFNRHTGYVVQEDAYFEVLTVRETLDIAASLKLPMSFTRDEKKARVDALIDELDLGRCENTRVGKIGEGISGGERRRLAMALELIDEPAVLLLDEPTSGLDSASALLVGKILKRLAKKKQITIIATIHQPRISLARMFDKIYFLAKGKELYFGPAFPNVVKHFLDAGHPIPEFENPMDFLLDLVNTQDAENFEVAETRDEIITHVHKFYKQSDYAKEYALGYTVPERFAASKLFAGMGEGNVYITPMWNQMWILFYRASLNNLREDMSLKTQAFNSVVMPLIFGAIYFNMDLSIQGVPDRLAAISLTILFVAFFAFDVLILLPKERKLFLREHASGMYSSFSFFIGRTTAELPAQVSLSLVNAAIAYFMFGLQADPVKFLYFWLALMLAMQAGASAFLAIGAMSPNMDTSNLLASVVLLIFMLFDGNWISLDKVPAGWRWIRHLSFMGTGSTAAVVNEYHGLTFSCVGSDFAAGACQYGPPTNSSVAQIAVPPGGTISGEQLLGQRGLSNVNVTRNLSYLLIHIVSWRLIALFFWTFFYRTEPASYLLKRAFCCCLRSKE